jgi:hypothetical protein
METDRKRRLRLDQTMGIFPVLYDDCEETVYFRQNLTTHQPTKNLVPVKPLLPPRPSAFALKLEVHCADCGLEVNILATVHFERYRDLSGRYMLRATGSCTDCNPRERTHLEFGATSKDKVPVDFVDWKSEGKPIPYLDDELFKIWSKRSFSMPARIFGDDGSHCWRDINHPASPGARWMKKTFVSVPELEGRLGFLLTTQPYKNRSETRATKSVSRRKSSASPK